MKAMATSILKELAKTLIDEMPNQKVFLILDFIREMEEKDRQDKERASFAFDNLVQHTERAERADEYIREFRDSDRI